MQALVSPVHDVDVNYNFLTANFTVHCSCVRLYMYHMVCEVWDGIVHTILYENDWEDCEVLESCRTGDGNSEHVWSTPKSGQLHIMGEMV